MKGDEFLQISKIVKKSDEYFELFILRIIFSPFSFSFADLYVLEPGY